MKFLIKQGFLELLGGIKMLVKTRQTAIKETIGSKTLSLLHQGHREPPSSTEYSSCWSTRGFYTGPAMFTAGKLVLVQKRTRPMPAGWLG
jgi:hypothetical protein